MSIALQAGMTAATYPDVPRAITQPDLRDIVHLVKAEYLEMPGMCLTPAQVRRLWNLDFHTAAAVLQQLVKEGFLCVTEAGTFERRDSHFHCD
jgi:hypothetical protein